jgi:peptidoglycan/xylan/chitin deacetylase (PgdA/CDA1 family)
VPKPLCSLSLDLDNLWSYLKTHGDPGWEAYPSYLDMVVPRVLRFLAERSLRITWFIVGKDAADPTHHPVLKSITAAGHEVGNHSFHHEPWLHLYSEAEIESELTRTEDAIETATGVRPDGFRGPGYSFSPTLLTVLARRRYRFDASTFPTFLGPLARLYYLATAKGLSPEEREKRKKLFGKFADGFRPLKPYTWKTAAGPLLEIPVTTMPLVKAPIHLSYVLYLGCFSRLLAKAYWRTALMMCRLFGVEPSILLHPLDFLGSDDTDRLSFFPAMQRSHAEKLKLAAEVFDALAASFECVPMGEHAAAIESRHAAKLLIPAASS